MPIPLPSTTNAHAHHHLAPSLSQTPLPTPSPSSPARLPMTTSAPPTYISAQNQNGVIAIVTGFSLCVVLLSVGVRLYARRYASAYRWDDAAFYATAALGVGQIAVGLYMVGKGLGKTVMELGVENFLKIRNVCFILFFFSFLAFWFAGWGEGDEIRWRELDRTALTHHRRKSQTTSSTSQSSTSPSCPAPSCSSG